MRANLVLSTISMGAVLVASAAARAADLTAPPPPPIFVPTLFSWTGFYAGGNLGAGFGRLSNRLDGPFRWSTGQPAEFTVSFHRSGRTANQGFESGFQGGYNWQFGQFVIGGEADLNVLHLRERRAFAGTVTLPASSTATGSGTTGTTGGTGTGGTGTGGTGTGGTTTGGTTGGTTTGTEATAGTKLTTGVMGRQELSWFGTLRPRLGFTPMDRLLIYGTTGAAFGRVNSRAIGFTAPADTGTPQQTFLTHQGSGIKWGWTAGAGVEYAFADNLSVKGEYLYVDLGRKRYALSNPEPAPRDIYFLGRGETKFQVVRAGLNYRF